jgi:hypothetical protein
MIHAWHPLDRPATRTEPAPEPTAQQQARRERYARLLYQNAADLTSWKLADRLAKAWGLSAAALGVAMPDDGITG